MVLPMMVWKRSSVLAGVAPRCSTSRRWLCGAMRGVPVVAADANPHTGFPVVTSQR